MADELKFYSLAEVARRLNVSWARAVSLHQAKCWQHDATANHTFLFRADRLGELRRQAEEWGLQKAIRARQKQISK